MLPNWLYGKSKSKLASILGGGGTPADYNQVKAQINSMVNVLGAKNLIPYPYQDLTKKTLNGITFTDNGDGSININGSTTNSSADFYMRWIDEPDNADLLKELRNKGTLRLSMGTTSNAFDIITDWYDSTKTYIASKRLNGAEYIDFNVPSTASYVAIVLRVFANAAVDNVTIYPMIRLASITDDTYAPYAKTNQELTEKLTSDTNLGTAVGLSTYTAYSNMFTAPSDGYVHVQSGASGSQVRTIYTYGNNTTAATDSHFTHTTSANNKAFEVYVRKGLKIYADGLQSDDTINFYPLL
jgi:hypothetical protein